MLTDAALRNLKPKSKIYKASVSIRRTHVDSSMNIERSTTEFCAFKPVAASYAATALRSGCSDAWANA